MTYLIQESLYSQFSEEGLLTALNKLGLKYEFFQIKYFVDEIFFETTDKNVMLFGAVKASRLSNKYNWYPGSFYNENHDYTIYSKYYKDNMLNWNSRIQAFSKELMSEDFPCFIRPTGDTKLFKGTAYYDKSSWDEDYLHSITNSPNSKSELIQIAPLKEIYQEYRCFIVKGKVVTASLYKLGSKILYKECIDTDIVDYANSMCSLYQPADAFVMDVCRTEDGLKIVELNCLNSCGFYDINIQKLIVSLENNF